MNHQMIDRRSLDLHRLIAEKIEKNPSLLERVKQRLRKSIRSRAHSEPAINALTEWLDILKQRSLNEILALLVDSGEEATRLRQNAPFLGILSQGERKEIFDRYYESAKIQPREEEKERLEFESLPPDEAQRRLRQSFPVADAELLIKESFERTERIRWEKKRADWMNRKQLQLAYLLAFNPLYLAYQLKKARKTAEEHESLQQLLPAALSLHRRLPESYNGDPVALKKLALAQAHSIAFRQRHKLRALAKVIGLEGDLRFSLEGEVPVELIRSVSTEIPAEMQPLFRRHRQHRD
jgi:hypothetical protein